MRTREALPLTHAQRTGEIVRLALDFGATVPEITRMVKLPVVALVHYLAAHGEAPTAARLADALTVHRTVRHSPGPTKPVATEREWLL